MCQLEVVRKFGAPRTTNDETTELVSTNPRTGIMSDSHNKHMQPWFSFCFINHGNVNNCNDVVQADSNFILARTLRKVEARFKRRTSFSVDDMTKVN